MPRDYIEFQARIDPIAFLITFRTYGTWIHGDERGSFHRQGPGKAVEPNPSLQKSDLAQLKHPPVTFNTAQRAAVESAIREVCQFRKYALYALNVRTNHVHCVVATGDTPEKAMTSFKSYVTRRLRDENLFHPDAVIWSRHGSTLYLWSENEVERALDYVVNGQGDDLPRLK
jgi:REP element-mobilizing transposase RayT